jgi:hypothetical protein
MKTWKNFFPLMRCPACRRWIRIRGRSEYKATLATAREVKEIRGEEEVRTDEDTRE